MNKGKSLAELLKEMRENKLYFLTLSQSRKHRGMTIHDDFFDYVDPYNDKYILDPDGLSNWIYTKQSNLTDSQKDNFYRAVYLMGYMCNKGLALIDWERVLELDLKTFYNVSMKAYAIIKRDHKDIAKEWDEAMIKKLAEVEAAKAGKEEKKSKGSKTPHEK